MLWGNFGGDFPLLFNTIWGKKTWLIQIPHPNLIGNVVAFPLVHLRDNFFKSCHSENCRWCVFLKCQKLANCWETWLYFERSLKRFRMAIGKPSPGPPEAKTVSSRTLRFSIFCKWALSFRATSSFSIQVEFELYNQIIYNYPQKKTWKQNNKKRQHLHIFCTSNHPFQTKERCALTPVTGSHSVALSGQNIRQEAPAASRCFQTKNWAISRAPTSAVNPWLSWLFLYLKFFLEAKIILMHFWCSPFTRTGVARTVEQPLSWYPFYLAEYTKIYSSWYDWNSLKMFQRWYDINSIT